MPVACGLWPVAIISVVKRTSASVVCMVIVFVVLMIHAVFSLVLQILLILNIDVKLAAFAKNA